MKNLNNKIFLTTSITYKNIEKKNKKRKSIGTGLKQRKRTANEDVSSR